MGPESTGIPVRVPLKIDLLLADTNLKLEL